MTFFRKGLLRGGETVPCFSKLITMQITVGALLLGMGPHIRRLNSKRWVWRVRRIPKIISGTLSVKLCRFC